MNKTNFVGCGLLALIPIGFYLLYCLFGMVDLRNTKIEIDSKRGEVWNSVDRANQVINREELYTIAFMSDRQELIDIVIQGRQILAIAKADHDAGKLTDEQYLDIVEEQTTKMGVVVSVESYPDVDLSQAQLALMDIAEGSFNRINKARSDLIEAQKNYNQKRTANVLAWLFTEDVEILGANSDPTANVAPSNFGGTEE